MKKFLLVLLMVCLPLVGMTEEVCSICGGISKLCLTDEYGAVYCSGTLVSYPPEQTVENYTVRTGTHTIGEYAFQSNEWLSHVILPEGVVMIDESAFSGCIALLDVQLPDSLLIIADSAFYYCPLLENIVLPQCLYAIGPSAFVDNWKMSTIDIPETVRYIGEEAFCNTGLTEIWIRSVDFAFGYAILHPGYLNDPAPPVTIHMCDAVIEEEIGSALHFYLAYRDWKNLTFRFDIPYFD